MTGSPPSAHPAALPLGVVDVHAHVVPEVLFEGPDALDPQVAALRTVRGRRRVELAGRELTSVVQEFVDPGVIVAESAAAGVDHLLLSPLANLVPVGEPAGAARRRCELLNAAMASIVSADPSRLSGLGAVPLEDPSEAVAALGAALEAGLAGVEVPANAADFLGDEALDPFWAAAEELRAVVFVHPATRGLGLPVLGEHYLWNTVGNPAETAVAAARLALGGVLERYQDLRVVLAHGGGVLPALAGRLAHGQEAVGPARGRLAQPIRRSLARFYVDTITHDAVQLRRLVEDLGADHVLLGSDRPFDMGDPDPLGTVRGLGLDGEDEAAILGANAARLIREARR